MRCSASGGVWYWRLCGCALASSKKKLNISSRGFCWISGRLGLRFGVERTPLDQSGLVSRCVVGSMPGSRCRDIYGARPRRAGLGESNSKRWCVTRLRQYTRGKERAMRWHRARRARPTSKKLGLGWPSCAAALRVSGATPLRAMTPCVGAPSLSAPRRPPTHICLRTPRGRAPRKNSTFSPADTHRRAPPPATHRVDPFHAPRTYPLRRRRASASPTPSSKSSIRSSSRRLVM